MKNLLLAFVLVAAIMPPAFAASNLKLEGKGRSVHLFTAGEIPEYLRHKSCERYAYEEKVMTTGISGADAAEEAQNKVGSYPGDATALRAEGACLLVLRKEEFLDDGKPATFYEIETFDGSETKEVRVGRNHKVIDDGRHELKSGKTFTTRDGVLTSAFPY